MRARPLDPGRTLSRLVVATLGIGLLVLVTAPAPLRGADASPSSEVALLADWLSGTFTSKAQAEADSAYYEVELRTTPIWTDRPDGPWLYVEQAMATHRDRPYRQRVYHLSESDQEILRSAVYTLPDPTRFIGGWQRPHLFDDLTPDSLAVREGCDILLSFDNDAFVGSTRATECQSSLRGATFATSEVRIEASRITSWDRGFDASGEQVWGAVSGPYAFDRMVAPKAHIE